MASVGKKLAALNFAKGKTALKPAFPSGKKTGISSRDELDGDRAFSKRKNSHEVLSANIGVGTPLYKGSKSTSMGSIHSEPDGPMDHDQIVQLTHYVRSLSEALALLKAVFTENDAGGETVAEDLRVSAHEKLGDVLGILKEILQKYPALHTTDVLTTAAMLITKIKSSHYEEVSQDAGNLLYMIDQLALAFSTSVSDYLMGDIDNFPAIAKTKSYDNIATDSTLDHSAASPDKGLREPDDEIDGVLQRLESHGGVDRALNQAKLWSKYVKEVITYVEKKNALENEYSKNLNKLANSLKNSVMKETFLPMQAIFCTAFDQDMDFSAASQTTCTIIQTQKVVEPLNARRLEHERNRKQLKDLWSKELKRMHEAVTNLHKARANYITRQQDHEKARESTQKAEMENLSGSTAGQATKLEKKRKMEEEAVYKGLEAETTYKACVAEANHRQKELEKVKCKVLAEVRDLIYHSDQIMKQVTVAYFQLLHTLSAPKPVQFQTLCEASNQYDPGSQYVEYVKRIHVPSDMFSAPEPFVFTPYIPEPKYHDYRRQGDESSPTKDGKHATTLKVQGEEDTDSISDSSSRSQESSPTASPYPSQKHSRGLEDKTDARLGVVSEKARMTFRGVELSDAACTHLFKKLRTLSKCRQCESYVYFQGAECERCGLSSHKKCLETLHFRCGDPAVTRRMTTFGVDFTEHVNETHTDIPSLVWKCTREIDERGLDIKGIYRVSGVKSKVESLCQEFELDESNVDLIEHHPNVIANVLKLYLRQLPEPLISFRLYPDFIKLAKEEQQSGGGQGPASPESIQRLTNLVKKLSQAQFKTCGHLMHHLSRVSAAQEMNQMNAYNIGVVFGPTLLRQSEDAVSLDALLDTPSQTRVVELLINNVEAVFGPVDQFNPSEDQEVAPSSATGTSPPQMDETDGAASPCKSPVSIVRSLPIETATSPDHSKTFLEPEKLGRNLPEITKDFVVSSVEIRPGVPVTPPPTLLEMAGTKSGPRPKDDGSPLASPHPTPPEICISDTEGGARSSRSMYRQSSPTSPGHRALKGPSHSAGAILETTTPEQLENLALRKMSPTSHKKKILASQVISRSSPHSRESSPTDRALPTLSKPQLFTPPSHRRLCRTGTGGLLERPVTPDHLLEISDSDSQDSLDIAVTLRTDTRPRDFRMERGLSKSFSVPNIADEADSPQSPQSRSIFYREISVADPQTYSVGMLDEANNNTTSDQTPAASQDIFPVKSPGAKSTFYAPSPRWGRRHSLEPLSNFSHKSPSTNRRMLLLKDEDREPKYV